ncbi:MAG: hypothetical protein CMF49_01090 [Legionellales bacterium]|nr:hypothetical protein [Legionellales bacterium]
MNKNKGQGPLYKIARTLKFNINKENESGLCYGISNSGMNAFLSRDIESFKKRFYFLFKNQNKDISFFEEHTKSKEEVYHYYNILAFFMTIFIIQNPSLYSFLFEENIELNQNSNVAYQLLLPLALIAPDNQTTLVYQTPCVFLSKKKFCNYFTKIAEVTTTPIAFQLNSITHIINLNYDPENKTWYFIEANAFPHILETQVFNDIAMQIAQFIFLSDKQFSNFFSVFMLKIYTNKKYENTLNSHLEQIQVKSFFDWKNIFNLTFKNNNDKYQLITLIISSCENEKGFIKLISSSDFYSEFSDFHTSLELCNLAKNDCLNGIEKLLDNNVNINACMPDGHTALSTAVLSGHSELVDYLLQRGADPTIKLKGISLYKITENKKIKFLLQNILIKKESINNFV